MKCESGDQKGRSAPSVSSILRASAELLRPNENAFAIRHASYHALLSILRKGLSVDAGPGLSYQLGSNYGPGDFSLSKGAHGKHVAGTTER